jgi:hypothetical protein
MVRYELELFADYHQFYLQDESTNGDLDEPWVEDSLELTVAVAPRTVKVNTARDMDVPVTVEICDASPAEDFGAWDMVNECSIEVPSGKLVVVGCTEFWPDAARIPLAPGTYRVRLHYGNLDTQDIFDGDDHYFVTLWPAPHAPLRMLKERDEPFTQPDAENA